MQHGRGAVSAQAVLFLLKRTPELLEQASHALTLAREAVWEEGIAFAEAMLSLAGLLSGDLDQMQAP